MFNLSSLQLELKKLIYYHFDTFKLRERNAIKKDPFLSEPSSWDAPNAIGKVGLIKEFWHLHQDYIKACRELNISYVLLDWSQSNWLEQTQNKALDLIIARPSVQYAPWKYMFDYRLKLLAQYCPDLKLFPSVDSLWIWESKLKTLDWLKVNQVSHPESWIFYDEEAAKTFALQCDYPIVYKSDRGSGSSGVVIAQNSRQLLRLIRRCFRKGFRTYRYAKIDTEHGYVILQKYLPEVKEWRLIRIGDYYFGFQKLRVGEFHSGSHDFSYGMPPISCLNFVREITDKFQMKHVDIDVFISVDGQIMVNEIQPYFGQFKDRELLVIDEQSGRLHYAPDTKKWVFEAGEFCRNNMCNLRLQSFLNQTAGEATR